MPHTERNPQAEEAPVTTLRPRTPQESSGTIGGAKKTKPRPARYINRSPSCSQNLRARHCIWITTKLGSGGVLRTRARALPGERLEQTQFKFRIHPCSTIAARHLVRPLPVAAPVSPPLIRRRARANVGQERPRGCPRSRLGLASTLARSPFNFLVWPAMRSSLRAVPSRRPSLCRQSPHRLKALRRATSAWRLTRAWLKRRA